MLAAGLAAALLPALAVGCGGGGATSDAEPGAAPVPAQPASGAAVDAGDLYFAAPETEVGVGEDVVWENVGQTIHTVKGDGFFSRAIDPGDSYVTSFDEPGSYDYLCTLHPTQMTGTIVVSK